MVGLAALWSASTQSVFAGSPSHTDTDTSQNGKAPAAPNCGPNWIVVTSPNAGTNMNWLNAVDAVSANDVWAVGYHNTSTSYKTLIERWNGTAWNVVPTPNIGLSSSLSGVTAISANDVWAVGNYQYSTDVFRTFTMHWNGSAWTVVPSPNQSQTVNYLSDVSASSANDVWAVGQYETSTATWTLAMHLIGGLWQIVSSPNVGLESTFKAVTAISANDVWAVGWYEYSAGVFRTFTQHWHDGEWHIIGSPNVGGTSNALYGVTAISTNNVWAVGNYRNGTNPHRTLIMQWNGSVWNVITSPNAGSGQQRLWAVEAVSANDVWAVGSYENSTGIYRTLIERWNGTDWNVVTSPNMGEDNEIFGVTAVSANDVWAVGTYHDNPVYSTLVERYNPCVPSPTPTFTPAPTQTPGGPTATPSACTIEFTDVPSGSTFYDFVRCMVCRGIINGYPCGRLASHASRRTTALTIAPTTTSPRPDCQDRLQLRRLLRPRRRPVIRGRASRPHLLRLHRQARQPGRDVGLPLRRPRRAVRAPDNRPYFRPNANAARGQLSKIVSNAANFTEPASGADSSRTCPRLHLLRLHRKTRQPGRDVRLPLRQPRRAMPPTRQPPLLPPRQQRHPRPDRQDSGQHLPPQLLHARQVGSTTLLTIQAKVR